MYFTENDFQIGLDADRTNLLRFFYYQHTNEIKLNAKLIHINVIVYIVYLLNSNKDNFDFVNTEGKRTRLILHILILLRLKATVFDLDEARSRGELSGGALYLLCGEASRRLRFYFVFCERDYVLFISFIFTLF